MQKKAAIIEFGTSHDDTFNSQIKFLTSSGYRVYLVLNKVFEKRTKSYEEVDGYYFADLDNGGYKDWKEVFKVWKFLRKNKIKYIILNTVQGTHIRNFCLLPHFGMNLTGIIHNAELLIGNSSTFRFYIKPFLKKYFALNKYIWDNVKLSNAYNCDWFYPIFNKISNYNLLQKPKDEFWIVIPGNVEIKRRDYFGLLDALEGKDLPNNIKFIFLGKSMHRRGNGSEIQQRIKELKLENNFILFDEYVDWDLFNEYTSKADLIATLIHQGAPVFKNYSAYKISGSYLVAFSNRVPLLCSDFFEQYSDISDSAFFYKENEIYKTIIELYLNPQIISEKRSIINDNIHFNFEFQRNKYINLIEK